MIVEQALYQFWSAFGVPAYEETSVPTGDDAPKFPYITYSTAKADFGNEVALSSSIWTRSTSWQQAVDLETLVYNSIGYGGKIIKIDNGAIWLKRGNPFSQPMGDDSDNMIKRKYINLTVEFATTN